MLSGRQGQRGQPGSSRTEVESVTGSPAPLAFLPDCILKSGSGRFRLGRRTLPKLHAGARVPAALVLPAVPEASGFCSSPPGSTSSRPQRPEPPLRAPQAQRPESPLPALPLGLPLARVTGVQFPVFSTQSKEGLRDLSATRPGARTSPGISSEPPRARLRLALRLDLVGNTLTLTSSFSSVPRCAWSCTLYALFTGGETEAPNSF